MHLRAFAVISLVLAFSSPPTFPQSKMLGPADDDTRKELINAQASQQNLIHVTITGLRNDKGQVLCALFSSPDDFPKRSDKAVAHARADISQGRAICEFAGIAPGSYAISVLHVDNSNGKMDTNFLGIPREGVGASNNAKGHLGPPKFADSAFRFAGDRSDLEITIKYL